MLERERDVGRVFLLDLWHGAGLPEGLAGDLEKLRAFWQAEPKTWDFWQRWYEGMLRGEPLDCELQRLVALIPDEDWKKGAAHIAEVIAGVEAEWLSAQLPQAEDLSFDGEQQVFVVTPIISDDAALLARCLSQVKFGLSLALSGNCGLNEYSTAVLYIRHTFENCRDDPNSVEQNFQIAADDIEAGIGSQSYSEDSKLTSLLSLLRQSVEEMRANHSVVAEAWRKRAVFRVANASHEQELAVLNAAKAFSDHTAGQLKPEQLLDARTVASSASVEVKGTALKRLIGRVSRMRLIAMTSEKIKALDASGGYKGARMLDLLHGLWQSIMAFF